MSEEFGEKREVRSESKRNRQKGAAPPQDSAPLFALHMRPHPTSCSGAPPSPPPPGAGALYPTEVEN
jgi:hypothetical protein